MHPSIKFAIAWAIIGFALQFAGADWTIVPSAIASGALLGWIASTAAVKTASRVTARDDTDPQDSDQ